MSIEHEQWDIVSSVGWTALLVAAGRAVESHRSDRLVDDPWAARFIEAAQPSSTVPVRPDQSWELKDDTLRAEADAYWSLMIDYMGVRSRFMDSLLDAAVGRGVRQVVLLAAGLDARALRLAWGEPVAVYEVDQDAVMKFKETVIEAHDGRPACDRRVVGVDLRDDWSGALRSAGFDPSQRTAWLAEGLLPFLPAAAEDQLLRTIDELSAPGSEIVAEQFDNAFQMMGTQRGMAAVAEPFGVDITTLASTEQRTPAAQQLGNLGWDVQVTPSPEVGRGYGRELGDLPDGQPFVTDLVTGTKG